MKKKLCALLALAVLLSLLLCSCERAADRAVVMKIDGMEVRADLYKYVYANFRDEDESAAADALKKKTEDALVNVFASVSLAADYGVSLEDDYFTDLAKYSYESAKAEEGFADNLEKSHMTDWVYRFLVKQNSLKDMIYASMKDSGDIAEGEELLSLVMGDGFIAVKQILIVGERREDGSFVPAKTHTDAEAEKIAAEVMKKAKDGEDFDALVREYGESLYMLQQPEGYYVCRGMWDDENEDAVFGLEIGEISGVVKSDAGYSVFMRCEKDENVARALLSDVGENYGGAIYTTKTEEKIAFLSNKVEYTEDFDRYITKDEK